MTNHGHLRVDGQGLVPSSVSGFIRDLTRQRLINFNEKEANVSGRDIGNERGEMKGVRGQAYPVLSKTLTIMECLNGEEKEKRKSKH